ncbi:hypothetical protein [Roseospira visakhapatnamensis]|uniref:Uncharacterized protein n=1 Tax=Roseospira visakhapatnamensis TaxID=390880 RepID=A0A7W6RE14_9PROT|nr:hypothetical protein [Roseospira visakhapatnamensis]MBB4266326.1 hypothetical protein [Roseospira visakhapatnamensis]
MTLMSKRSLEDLLADTARSYLIRACRLEDTVADGVARQAAHRVAASLGPMSIQDAQPAVVRTARQMARDLPGRPRPDARPLVPEADGRPMREQPLDPLTLAELGDRSRRSGRRLIGRLPTLLSTALAVPALGLAMLGISSVTPTDPPV